MTDFHFFLLQVSGPLCLVRPVVIFPLLFHSTNKNTTLAQATNQLQMDKWVVWLVISTPLKNISQLGWLFPIYGKIKAMFQTTNQSESWTNGWFILGLRTRRYDNDMITMQKETRNVVKTAPFWGQWTQLREEWSSKREEPARKKHLRPALLVGLAS